MGRFAGAPFPFSQQLTRSNNPPSVGSTLATSTRSIRNRVEKRFEFAIGTDRLDAYRPGPDRSRRRATARSRGSGTDADRLALMCRAMRRACSLQPTKRMRRLQPRSDGTQAEKPLQQPAPSRSATPGCNRTRTARKTRLMIGCAFNSKLSPRFPTKPQQATGQQDGVDPPQGQWADRSCTTRTGTGSGSASR